MANPAPSAKHLRRLRNQYSVFALASAAAIIFPHMTTLVIMMLVNTSVWILAVLTLHADIRSAAVETQTSPGGTHVERDRKPT